MDTSLEGKVAIVTGAGQGIGTEVARLLARRGATVVLADIDAARTEAPAAAIREAGGKAVAIGFDLTRDGTGRRSRPPHRRRAGPDRHHPQ